MKNKLFLLGMLVIALTFGMAVVGCDDDSGGGDDTWSNVTSLSQLNGTWKYSDSRTSTAQELSGMTNEEWESSSMSTIYGNDMRITGTVERTLVINASAKTISSSSKEISIYSGSKIDTAWAKITEEVTEGSFDYEGGTGTIQLNNANHSITTTFVTLPQTIDDHQIYGIQINKSGTQIKNGDMILTKQ